MTPLFVSCVGSISSSRVFAWSRRRILDQARQALAEEPVDVVLLDLHLGHERGLDLLHELRRDRPEIGVALLTGSPQRRARQRRRRG